MRRRMKKTVMIAMTIIYFLLSGSNINIIHDTITISIHRHTFYM